MKLSFEQTSVCCPQRVIVEVATGRSDIAANAAKWNSPGEIVFVFTDPRTKNEHAAALQGVVPAARVLTTADLASLRW